MTRLPHPVLFWAANVLVPGAGMVLLGRMGRGVLLAALWGMSAAGCLLGQVWSAPLVRVVGACLMVWIFAISQVALLAGLRAARRRLADPARNDKFKEALAAYLRGRYDDSEAVCRDLLRADPDDVEAMLQLAAIARRRGDAAAARRYLGQARYLDDDGVWDFEIGRELAALAPTPVPAGK